MTGLDLIKILIHAQLFQSCNLCLLSFGTSRRHPPRDTWPLYWYSFLYADRFTLWKTSGVSHNYISGGYSFSVTWRYTLPGVHSSALGMSTFKTGAGKVLNLHTEMTSLTTSKSIININPLSNNSGIVYVSYSVVVIT